jgi:hypothetical protein
MVPVDLSTAVKSNGTDRHGDKKGFYARPSDFLSNTSNWKVSNFRGSAPAVRHSDQHSDPSLASSRRFVHVLRPV